MSDDCPDAVVLREVRKTYGSTVALMDVSLRIHRGEFVTLLGPSGSGKTTCLRTIAGTVRPDSGTLEIAGRDVSRLPVHKRNIGMVFQNYSLFPHLTVAQNVAYPLRIRGLDRRQAQREIDAALATVHLVGFGHRRPDQLSGGQQQRVALARALIFGPDVLLLDEPLSALDRVLREEMQLELRRIHRETGTTMVCVTHDRSEALAMSDRIVVMRAGEIVQDGDPAEIYRQSRSRFVAEFLGETNVIAVTLTDGMLRDVTGRTLPLPAGLHLTGTAADYVVRVESVGLSPATGGGDWLGTVTEALFLGDAVRFVVACPPHTLTARLPLDRAQGIRIGSDVAVDLASGSPMVFAS